MKAVVVIPKKRSSLHLIDVPRPEICGNGMLVKVEQVGVDGTDFDIYNGLYGQAPENSPYLIIGHESIGRVEALGPEVNGFSLGDYVVCLVRRRCPENCLNCSKGQFDMCLTGNYKERGIKGLNGFMTEYYSDSHEYFVKVPKEIRELGVFVEPLSIIEKAVSSIFKIQKRALWKPRIGVVLGAGGLGLLATLLLVSTGIKTYSVSRGTKESLKAKLAAATGAEYISTQDIPINKLSSHLGEIDLVIEATGSSYAVFNAMEVLGKNGIMAVTGIPAGSKTALIDADRINTKMVLDNNVIFGVVNANKTHYQSAVNHILEFKCHWKSVLEKMITRKVPLSKAGEIFRNSSSDIKPIVQIS